MIKLRKGKSEDAQEIAECLFLAMEEIIFTFIGEPDPQEGKKFLAHLIALPNNQYSHENCWVLELEGNVVGAILAYNGGKLHALRKPVLEYLSSQYNFKTVPEDETQEGEFYLDSFGVLPEFQGRGLGTKMLSSWIEECKTFQKLPIGLLVDEENPQAKKLYERLGFHYVKSLDFVGRKLLHYQLVF